MRTSYLGSPWGGGGGGRERVQSAPAPETGQLFAENIFSGKFYRMGPGADMGGGGVRVEG